MVASSVPRTIRVVKCYLRSGRCYDVNEPGQPSDDIDDIDADTEPAVAEPSKGTAPHLVVCTRYSAAPPLSFLQYFITRSRHRPHDVRVCRPGLHAAPSTLPVQHAARCLCPAALVCSVKFYVCTHAPPIRPHNPLLLYSPAPIAQHDLASCCRGSRISRSPAR